MTRSGSFARPAHLSLEETHESQDSQAILDALKAEFGVGTLSDSPASPGSPRSSGTETRNAKGGAGRSVEGTETLGEAGDAVQPVGGHLRTRSKKKQSTPHQAANDDVNAPSTGIYHTHQHQHQHQAPDGFIRQQYFGSDAVVIARSPPTEPLQFTLHDATQPAVRAHPKLHPVPAGAGGSQAKRMETSQQTPTQVNEDRDYDEYCQPDESSPPLADTLRSPNEERTLQAGDTGAVNFGNLSPVVRPSSQVSEDGGFENTRGDWRAPDLTSQQLSSHGYTPRKASVVPPETPALSKNPFAAQSNGSVPFAGTQLFGQTPLMTSAAKINSPTSSRPSPNLFHHTISPNNLETSPLKNRANVSSPTVMGTSSPPRLNDVPATVMKLRISPIQEETPFENREIRDDMIPESPTIQPAKVVESRPQPLAYYEPMKKSQERKAGVEVPPIALAIDSDSDDAIIKMRRKKKMDRIRLEAAEEMGKVRVQLPPRGESGEGRDRKRRKMNEVEDVANPMVSSNGKSRVTRLGSQKELVQSLEVPSAESTKATPGEETVAISSGDGNETIVAERRKKKEATDEDMIPATSPVRSLSVGGQLGMVSNSEPELPALAEGIPEEEKDSEHDARTSSLPPLRRRTQRTYGKRAQPQRRTIISSSIASNRASAEPELESALKNVQAEPSSAIPNVTDERAPKLPAAQDDEIKADNVNTAMARSPPSRLRSTSAAPAKRPSRLREMTPQTPHRPRTADPAAQASSSLSALSTTSVASSKTTPNTQPSPASDRTASVGLPSPAPVRSTRSRASRQASKEKSPQLPSRLVRMTKRAARIESESTDELQQSPSSSAMELNMALPRSSRVFRQSIGQIFRGRRLFEGMVFAISMPSDKENQQKRSNLEGKILQAGGLILQSGFQDLFEPSTVLSTLGQLTDEGNSLRLSRANVDCGFTALIADQHSRKVKYMQALALGLPCLAHQWITACLNKGAIVDWEPYLLAAGASAVLGDAIKSRHLQAYSAADARLADVVERRPKLLAGQSLLAVVDHKKNRTDGKKSEDEVKKQQYMFLAQALGPSIHRVSTTQQAREALQQFARTGTPFTWLYLDESIGTLESVIVKTEAAGKKRRRSSAPPKTWNIRVLHDELVIQSLILGRMVDDDEMYY